MKEYGEKKDTRKSGFSLWLLQHLYSKGVASGPPPATLSPCKLLVIHKSDHTVDKYLLALFGKSLEIREILQILSALRLFEYRGSELLQSPFALRFSQLARMIKPASKKMIPNNELPI